MLAMTVRRMYVFGTIGRRCPPGGRRRARAVAVGAGRQCLSSRGGSGCWVTQVAAVSVVVVASVAAVVVGAAAVVDAAIVAVTVTVVGVAPVASAVIVIVVSVAHRCCYFRRNRRCCCCWGCRCVQGGGVVGVGSSIGNGFHVGCAGDFIDDLECGG